MEVSGCVKHSLDRNYTSSDCAHAPQTKWHAGNLKLCVKGSCWCSVCCVHCAWWVLEGDVVHTQYTEWVGRSMELASQCGPDSHHIACGWHLCFKKDLCWTKIKSKGHLASDRRLETTVQKRSVAAVGESRGDDLIMSCASFLTLHVKGHRCEEDLRVWLVKSIFSLVLILLKLEWCNLYLISVVSLVNSEACVSAHFKPPCCYS